MSWAGQFHYDIGKTRRAVSSDSTPQFDPSRTTLLCLSHLRWSFVYQRPQHLMSRFAGDFNVLFWEEPIACDESEPWLQVRGEEGGLHVLVPRLPAGCTGDAAVQVQRQLLDGYLAELGARDLLLWYYTPMSQSFSAHLRPRAIVYDCMDELSAFRGAPPELVQRERELLQRADVVFTGGYSIWEAKRALHSNTHAFPSSVDVAHFAAARQPQQEPADQADIPHPRLGFYGVIDERFDVALLRDIAEQRPQWQFVMIGPVVKIAASELPQAANIHYLGGKTYDELPGYLSGWEVALMPFAMNASTRFISPTKTPEYLAGGCPVVSTPIHDVVRTYGDTGVVRIADTAAAFVAACEAALRDGADREQLLETADQVLGDMSWDHTYDLMKEKLTWKQ
ncbi:glycosyltransferase family 1 protein [Xanthomonas arboricola pv. juglandis]|uniref:glycosyltransferase family 1 protein n=1 Tax=Xanthomonas arboricola TaxID=56448 RepID=UPI00063EB674|nr:glycosyltransferase family 1 protein [Xanthomonas arboricola]MDN0222059.1 glycosyltransferase family 1 protein [Xanthomonas arboricola pv. juglandis]MDN0226217.1 glycosyltransferase family 1 protein [Xanthomonas arboricola pv. juglandis]MDN0230554.1 glycosyltransferase family 1 protein [Xanthomonas arboricola pv. juglandis]MDN0234742.1 glycosyltransferase family 1 protein [Xanthomonas arboricola pv. juglandis]MDN0239046.1 glycosyltransferase family 1 protein [Xanthomonas arboricola pv. jugl